MLVNPVNFNLNTKVVQNQGNIVSDMSGEKVMMSIQNNKYYNLGVTGGIIWDLIKYPTTLKDLISNLVSNFEVDILECETQVLSFVEVLSAEGLIQTVE